MDRIDESINVIWVGMYKNYFSLNDNEKIEVEQFLEDNGYYLISTNENEFNIFISYL